MYNCITLLCIWNIVSQLHLNKKYILRIKETHVVRIHHAQIQKTNLALWYPKQPIPLVAKSF